MRPLVSLALTALISSALHAQVTGTVITSDGAPLKGAVIMAFAPETTEVAFARLTSSEPKRAPLAQTSSGENGRFSLDVKKAAQVQLLVTAPRMAPFALDATAVEEVGAIAMRVETIKAGRISAAGKAVANAVVRLEIGGAEIILETDPQGKYEAPDPGKWVTQIAVFHPDYAMQQRTPAFRGGISLDFQLERGSELQGKVVAENGETPVPAAKIWIDGIPSGQTGSDGSFVVRHAPSRWKEVRAVAGLRAAFKSRVAGPIQLRLGRASGLSGSVVDGRTEGPLSGAVVSLHSGGNQFGRKMAIKAVTDAKGAFIFDGLAPDRYSLSATSSGYGSESVDIQLREGAGVVKKVSLTKNARITGVVIDEAKKTLSSVRIRTLSEAPMGRPTRPQPSASASTAPDGSFVLRNVGPDQQLVVEARKKGYPPAKTATLKIAPGDTRRNTVITLPAGLEVRGRVVNAAGEPISGVAVTPAESRAHRGMILVMSQRDDARDEVQTGADGTFVLRLTEGSYDFSFKGEGWASVQRNEISVNPAMEPISVTMTPAVEIVGRLVNADDTPVVGATVMSFATDAASSGTGGDGGFVISGLKSGQVTVQFRKEEDLIFDVRTLTAPDRDLIVKLENSSAIMGRVIDATTKRPVANFRAGLSGDRGNAVMRSFGPPMMVPFRNDDGSFTLERVKPGSLQLIVDAPGYVRATTTVVVPADGPLKDLEVALEVGARIAGKVTGPDAKAVSGVTVRIEAEGGGMLRGGPMNDMNNFAATDAAGEYSLDGHKPGERNLVFEAQGFAVERKRLKVTEGENRLDVKLSRGISVSGSVVTETGSAVAGAEVRASSPASGNRATTVSRSDAAGAFTFEGLVAGRYSISATKAGLVEAELKDVDVASGGPLKLIMKRGGTVIGTVTGLRAEELTSTNVFASGAQSAATVDGQGRFRVEGVPAGSTRVHASVGRFGGSSRRTETKVVDVAAGAEAEVALSFDSEITVRGRVTRNASAASNISVVFTPVQPGVGSYTVVNTDSDGRYEAVGISNGRYNVIVSDLATSSSYVVKYEVSGSDTFDIEIRTGALRGRVIDGQTNAPVASADVTVMPSGVQSTMMMQMDKRSSPDGTFVADLNEGSFDVTVTKEGYGALTRTVEVTAGDGNDVTFEMARSGGAVLRVIDARDGRALISGVNVHDSMNRPVFADFLEPRADGSIQVPLANGSFRTSIHVQGYATRLVTITVPGAELQVSMTPGGGLTVQNRGLRVGGRLVLPNGTVYPMNFRRDEFVLQPGTAKLEHIAPGSYVLQLIDDRGTVTATHPVTITEGQVTNLGI